MATKSVYRLNLVEVEAVALTREVSGKPGKTLKEFEQNSGDLASILTRSVWLRQEQHKRQVRPSPQAKPGYKDPGFFWLVKQGEAA